MSIVESIYQENSRRLPLTENMRTRDTISLRESLASRHRSGLIPVIGEFKRSSPSGFKLAQGISMTQYMNRLADLKVAGISVLTEPKHFLGSYSDLKEAQVYKLPLLAKDFISSEQMVQSSYNAGADAILLIADFLPKQDIKRLTDYAGKLGMETLVEFHDPTFLGNYDACDTCLLGYNRRNLVTMRIEDKTASVIKQMKKIHSPMILESGLTYGKIDPHLIEEFDGFLIGTSLLNAPEAIR